MTKITEFARNIKSRNWTNIAWDGHLDLLQWPQSEKLHAQFEARDMKLLLDLVEASGEVPLGRKFGVRLLANIRAPEVLALFRLEWQKAEKAEDYKMMTEFLVWRLADYEELTEAEHRRLFQYISRDLAFSHFKQQFIHFCGGDPKKVLDVVRQRLADDRFPACKNWLYLCGACAHSDSAAVAALLQEYGADQKDKFSGEVAKTLLQVEDRNGMV